MTRTADPDDQPSMRRVQQRLDESTRKGRTAGTGAHDRGRCTRVDAARRAGPAYVSNEDGAEFCACKRARLPPPRGAAYRSRPVRQAVVALSGTLCSSLDGRVRADRAVRVPTHGGRCRRCRWRRSQSGNLSPALRLSGAPPSRSTPRRGREVKRADRNSDSHGPLPRPPTSSASRMPHTQRRCLGDRVEARPRRQYL